MNMINAKELRIGNWVQWSVFASMGMGIEQIKLEHCEHWFNYSNFLEPIELTEDILIKCGFQKVHGYIYLTHDALNLATLQYDKEKRIVWLEFEGTICGREIQYLHELQNLYFDLTGEELNIELNAQGSDTTKA